MNIKYTAIICACLGLGLMTKVNGMSQEQQNKLDKQLSEAVYNDTLDEVKNLVRQGANVNTTNKHGTPLLLIAILFKDEEIAKYLIANGADIHTPIADGITFLMAASNYAHLFELVKFLVENGADINLTDKKGRTALSIAQSNSKNDCYTAEDRQKFAKIAEFLEDPYKYKLSRQLVVIKDTKGNRSAGGPDVNFKFVNNQK